LELKRARYVRYEHLPLRHKSGTPIEVEFVSNLYEVNHQLVAQCNIRDVTERNRASKALRESEERFRVTFDQASIGIAQIGLDGQLLRINHRYGALLGYSPEELMSRGLQAVTHSDDQATDSAFARRAIAGEMSSYSMDKRHWRKDGTLIWVNVTNTVAYDASHRPNYFLSVVQDTSVVQDITARKKLEEELLQARKMEAIGRLAGGVAHDFNNLLTVITGYCARILQRSGDEDTLCHEVGEISMAADRAAALTAKLLAFSRRQVLQRRITNLNKAIVEVRELIQRLIGEDIELVTVVEPGLGLVEADEGQVGQVIMNLAVNARDAMPAGGTISIHLSNVFLSEEYALSHLGVCSGRYLALSVRDTGCGMDAETQARMFEPFFTTKELGKGTGLGLSTVYGIVKEHGGHVSVESAPGTGTTVTVYLPRVEGAVAEGEMASIRTRTGGAERILVVEDDIQLRQLTVEVLRGAGYAVWEADNGEHALELIARETGPIHLMLTDIVMPRMNGRALAERVLSARQCGAVLYMSGYAGEQPADVEAIPAGAPLLVKPFTPERLLEIVRTTLDAGSGHTNRSARD
jgi:PAS domain S-box-containing protein